MRLGDLDALMEITNQQGHLTVDDILNEPTIDAVPVVRCKDCIHYEERSCEQGLCHFWDCSPEYGLNVVVFNDFCSYGERKDGE